MDFDRWIAEAWAAHADDPAATAARALAEGAASATTDAQLARLAQLLHHLWGEHLGRWTEGRQALAALQAHPACGPDASAAVRRYRMSLVLSAGDAAPEPGADPLAALAPSDRIRVEALGVAILASRDTMRAAALFHSAMARAEAANLPDRDPALRELAVTANNLACALEEAGARRGAPERELMIVLAQAARRYWGLAGGWLEVERAEYRLAMSWLQAGDPARARSHAERCLATVQAHGGPAFERFFGWEALARAERAAGDAAAEARALARAREAYAELDGAERESCRPSLEAIERAP